jgi:hypothetical protein
MTRGRHVLRLEVCALCTALLGVCAAAQRAAGQQAAERSIGDEIGSVRWRLHREDAVYRAGGGILVPPGVSGASFVTAILQLDVTWRLSPFLALQAAFVDAPAGTLIRDAGGRDTTLLLAAADLRF